MEITIGNKKIGTGHPSFIIAELSANHNQDIEVAIKTIKAAKDCGADAVKTQTYTADTLTLDCKNDFFRLDHGTIWDGLYMHDLYKEAYTPWEWQSKLKQIANDLGMEFFSSPFDNSAVDFLEELNVPAYKIASLEITDIPLIKYVASKNKPIILSTGASILEDIQLAIETCREQGNSQISVLKCTSSYPAPVDEADLLTMIDFKQRFNVICGLSDHTVGDTVAITAVALGGNIIEKHFILDRNIGGPDSSFSMEPHEFKTMTNNIRIAEKAIGEVNYEPSDKIIKIREQCRSLFIVEDIKAGDLFTNENIRSIRPGYGLPPKYFEEIIGKQAKEDLERGNPLKWEHIK